MMNPCPECGSTHVTRLPLIWQQETRVTSRGGVNTSLEALSVSPPERLPIARMVVAVFAGALIVGPMFASVAGKGVGFVVAAGFLLFAGLPLLKRIHWNTVELPYRQRLWANTFACRSCGARWNVDQSLSRPPATSLERKAAVIAALAVFVLGPTVLVLANASEGPRPLAGAAASTSADVLFIHGMMNVRSGPGEGYPVTARLTRGSQVTLGPKDANGWAELRSADGAPGGYVFRASELVKSYRP
jgi:hypothetical protein